MQWLYKMVQGLGRHNKGGARKEGLLMLCRSPCFSFLCVLSKSLQICPKLLGALEETCSIVPLGPGIHDSLQPLGLPPAWCIGGSEGCSWKRIVSGRMLCGQCLCCSFKCRLLDTQLLSIEQVTAFG